MAPLDQLMSLDRVVAGGWGRGRGGGNVTYVKYVKITLLEKRFFGIDDRLYSSILRSLEQTHCARVWFYMSD